MRELNSTLGRLRPMACAAYRPCGLHWRTKAAVPKSHSAVGDTELKQGPRVVRFAALAHEFAAPQHWLATSRTVRPANVLSTDRAGLVLL